MQDSSDDLFIGYGAAAGTTPAIGIDEDQQVTISSSVMYPTEVLTADPNIEATECGTTYFIDASGEAEYDITLPAIGDVSAGCKFVFIVTNAPESGNYIIKTDTLEDVIIGGTYESGAAGGAFVTTGDTITFADGSAVLGDKVIMVSNGSAFYTTAFANVVAGIVLSDEN